MMRRSVARRLLAALACVLTHGYCSGLALSLAEWKKLADATAGGRSLPSAAAADHKVAIGGVSCEEEGEVDEQQADANAYSTLFHGSLDRSSRAAASAAEAHRVVDAYSNFLGTPPPPDAAAELQLAEIALFTIDKVLVPGADFPLQIVKDNHAGKDMIDSTAATETRRFGVVTTPSFRTRPTETLTERTLPDQSRSAAAAAVEGEGEGDEGLLQPPKMRRDADGREIAMPKTRVFTRVGCMAEIYAEPTRLDDGRYIVETRGSLPFRIVDIVAEEPHVVAVVQLLQDPPVPEGEEDEQLRQAEIDSWQALNDVCWLACELFDKRSWLPLLMELDGKQHPLHHMKMYAPEERQAGVAPALTQASARKAWMKRQQFSWELVKILRQGVPGLWDIDFTGNKLADMDVLKLMQDLDISSRVTMAEKELKKARYMLRQHQRLSDIVQKRDQAPRGFH